MASPLLSALVRSSSSRIAVPTAPFALLSLSQSRSYASHPLPSNPEPEPAKPAAEPKPSLAAQYLDLDVPASSKDTALQTEQHFDGTPHARSTLNKRRLSSIEKKRQAYSRIGLVLGLFGVGYGGWYLGRDWESESERRRVLGAAAESLGDAASVAEETRFFRTKARIIDYTDVCSHLLSVEES